MKQWLAALFFLTLVNPGFAAEDLRGDTVDIRSYKLNLDLSDFTGKILHGEAVIGCKSKMSGVSTVSFDLLKLTVDSVMADGYYVPFIYNDTLLNIDLLNTFNTGDSFTVRIFYHGRPLQLPGDFGGFYWTNTYAFNIGVSFLAEPHNYGRVWFPCFDNFRERSLYEFFVTTKNTHKAFCNGLLQSVTTSGSTKTWHWKFAQEIPSYLASVSVSDYQTLTDTVNGIGGTKEIQLAARAADTSAMKNLFVHLPDAFHIQEELWGEYKWDRIGYCIVPFNAGAMEHATNISFMQYYLGVLDYDCENTMVHELSHHWFGDLVTCDSASEMWLNEGWAVYNEMLFHERFYGEENYKTEVRKNHEDVLHSAHLDDSGYLPVSGVPTEQTYGSTVYNKGSDVIHTLRWYMGDSLFFSCMKSFLNDYSFQNASTAQLRDYLSQCSGKNLNDCFNDWIYTEGFPHFSIERITPGTKTIGGNVLRYYTIDIRQRLHNAPHYYNHVPVNISYFDGTGLVATERVTLSGECSQIVSQDFFGVMPEYIALDFDEKLQDAITDEWKVIADTGSYDFGTAKMVVHATGYTASGNILRVLHNWIRPQPMRTKIPALHLHDKRYWTVEGNAAIGADASATINYDGNDASLDNTFITNSEDSLLIMWRANADSEWVIADLFAINKQGSAADKIGSATIYNLKKGQYCFAIWNSSVADTTTPEGGCVYSAVRELTLEEKSFELFPNPASETVMVSFSKGIFLELELSDLSGKKITEYKITPEQSLLEVKMRSLSAGTYLVTLCGKDGNRTTKKLVKQ